MHISRFMRTEFVMTALRLLGCRYKNEAGIAVSVLLTAWNSASYLNLCLATLENQILPRAIWEIVIVGDVSQDGTQAVLDRYERQMHVRPVQIRSVKQYRRIELLNEALNVVQGRIIVFLGDDRLVEPDFLLQHLILHRDKACIAIGDDHRSIHTHLFAPDEPALNGTAPRPLLFPKDLENPQQMAALISADDNDYGEIFAYFDAQHRTPPCPWAYFKTANASVPREAIERIGGFDELFSGWGLEDTDLAYRLHQTGLGFQFAPKAVTLRQLCPSKVGQKRDLTRNLNHFLCKHKEMTDLERGLVLHGHYAPME